MQVVAHNLQAQFTDRILNINTNKKSKAMERLSSGYKINRAGDNAAGLAISEKMRSQIRGLDQASKNIQDGNSYCQVADAALEEVHSYLQRINELATQAANDTNTNSDRGQLDLEVQELKEGIKDIFLDTTYNSMYIFRIPYVPDIDGSQTAWEIFNNIDDTTSGTNYGGISIDSRRYTWDELELTFPLEAGETSKEIIGDDGEVYQFHIEEDGDNPPKIRRENTWSADETGIYINEALAVTWSSLGASDGNIPEEITFSHKGQNISFTTDGASELKDLIDGINGDNLDNISWDDVFSSTYESPAVTMTDKTQAVAINFGNKDNISTASPAYTVHADEEGVWVTSGQTGNAFRKIAWTAFTDTTGGGHNITDWGATDGSYPQTFNSSARYTYSTDTSAGEPAISFSFKLADEASLEEVIKGLNGVNIYSSITAPITATTNYSSDYGTLSVSYAQMSFEKQRADGRAFSSNTETFDFDGLSLSNNGDDTYTLTYHLDNLDSDLTATLSKAQVEAAITNETSVDLNFTGDAGSMRFVFTPTRHEDEDAEAAAAAAINSLNGVQVYIKGNGAATQSFGNYGANRSTNYHSVFSIELNPPEKLLHIQSTARAYDSIDIRYSGMNLAVLGMSGVNTKDGSASQSAMATTQNSIDKLSRLRAVFGSYMNRLSYARRIDDYTSENTSAAESRIRDVDMADEMVFFSNTSILTQAGMAMLSQANQLNQGVLSLLQG